jgi:hypothetical protein
MVRIWMSETDASDCMEHLSIPIFPFATPKKLASRPDFQSLDSPFSHAKPMVPSLSSFPQTASKFQAHTQDLWSP